MTPAVSIVFWRNESGVWLLVDAQEDEAKARLQWRPDTEDVRAVRYVAEAK